MLSGRRIMMVYWLERKHKYAFLVTHTIVSWSSGHRDRLWMRKWRVRIILEEPSVKSLCGKQLNYVWEKDKIK